ncbi:MAG: hypothetical protein QW746_04495 [Thermoplasmata archaeon]
MMFSGGWQPSGSGSDPSKVPYTGATANVDLGSYSIKAYKVEASNEINSDNGIITSDVASGSSAIGFYLNTKNSFNDGKLLSLRSGGTEKVYVDYIGRIYATVGDSRFGGLYVDSDRVYIKTNTMNSVGGAGITTYYNGRLILYNSSLTDATNVEAFRFDTGNQLTTAGRKLVSINNYGVEKFHIDKDGKTMMNNAKFVGYTLSTSDPSTTELPNNNDFGFHKNTSSGALYLAFNDGGSIKKVQLT